MERKQHFKTFVAKPLCRVTLRSERDYLHIHCWKVEETGEVIYSTSPEWLGIRWVEGSASSLEEAVAEVIKWANREGSWRGATYEVASVAPPEYGEVKVQYWSSQARRAFGIALAGVGGVRRLATGRWDPVDPTIVRAFPDPMTEEPTNFQFARFVTKPKRRDDA